MGGVEHISLEEVEEYSMVVNKTFSSEEDGYEFYNSYAKVKGFGVRRGKTRKKGERVIWRRLLCSCEGYRSIEHFEKSVQVREPRTLTRCGCEARLDIQLNEESGTWFVTDFKDSHSHALAKPGEAFVLRSHRGLSEAQKAEAIELGIGGLRTCQIMDVMEKNHGGFEKTGFLARDLYNFIARKKKKKVEGSDADFVLNYMREKQAEDSEYFFKYTQDAQGRLKNIFWADSQSQIDYDAFGNVVVFDSTYRVNRYNLPFVPFIGVNHHRSTVVFGCGIISNESVSSYVWLLDTLLEVMNQKHPKSLITDGDASMARAIEMVMPVADHRLCSWHIEQNMVKYLKGEKLKEFRKFIYHSMEVAEFERRWVDFKETHKITENDVWIWKMYELRNKWSAAHTNGRHFLGMRSNQRSESLNSRLHKHLDRTMSLVDLVEHYEFCLSRIRRNEAELDAKASLSIPFTRITADIYEKRAARIYTPTMFRKVRVQIRKLPEWEVKEVTIVDRVVSYQVAPIGSSENHFDVSCTFDGSMMITASCPCRMIECEAIPCTHIFAAMRFVGLDTIPPCCVQNRWTTVAKLAFASNRYSNTHVWSEQMDRFHDLRMKANIVLFKASRTEEQSDKVMRILDAIRDEDVENNGGMEATYSWSLPSHFSGAARSSTTRVLDPERIISKGAPSKRLKRFHEAGSQK
ncbi:protein FAR1-RELATED SEQUENCE 5-like [Phragmites australis]|uniref:protein FAR1-RELATED SEQUENCE 5-like n=1 Tax=Phragmites australis TaxID=29695 RepID=UPI002D785AEF|nr:protein FAR1-RELATED SEQUENCE 5-like [Phragmites australis]